MLAHPCHREPRLRGDSAQIRQISHVTDWCVVDLVDVVDVVEVARGRPSPTNSPTQRATRPRCAISLRGHERHRPHQPLRAGTPAVRARGTRALARRRRVPGPLLRSLHRATARRCARERRDDRDLPAHAHGDPHRVRGAAEDPRARAAGGAVRVRPVWAGQRAGVARARGGHSHRGRVRAASARTRRARAVRRAESRSRSGQRHREDRVSHPAARRAAQRSTGMPGS